MRLALLDSFDTPRAMCVLADLIKEANIYVSTAKSDMDIHRLESIAKWVTKMVRIFGLDANATQSYNGLGWASSASNSKLSAEEIVEPYSRVYKKKSHQRSQGLWPILQSPRQADSS